MSIPALWCVIQLSSDFSCKIRVLDGFALLRLCANSSLFVAKVLFAFRLVWGRVCIGLTSLHLEGRPWAVMTFRHHIHSIVGVLAKGQPFFKKIDIYLILCAGACFKFNHAYLLLLKRGMQWIVAGPMWLQWLGAFLNFDILHYFDSFDCIWFKFDVLVLLLSILFIWGVVWYYANLLILMRNCDLSIVLLSS